MATTAPTPGSGSRADWYLDPHDPELIRYWDGRGWTPYTLPTPAAWGLGAAGAALPWWQTWWAVVPGLMLCLPFGLIGLWRRPGSSVWLRAGLTVASVLLLGVALLPEDEPAPPQTKMATASDPSDPTDAPPSGPTAAVSEPVTSTMPEIIGLSRKEAVRELTAAGLIVSEVRKVPSAEPQGTVLRQSSKVGATLRAGEAVVLVVAAPYPRVPDVTGQSRSAASARLRDAGFKVEVTTEVRTSGRNGVVLRQTPAGSKRIKPRSVVTIVLASVVRPVAPPVESCTSGYDPCLTPESDYDCAGGSGDGPGYASGPIYVTGSDPYDLDRDGDGVACES